ncbi:MAG: pilus assembly protein CpaE [Chloroflexota bacterium]|jgi:pilus assembly protein CpaE|nr:pilus assembly protein CpaE [Chloroflexota bacterium]
MRIVVVQPNEKLRTALRTMLQADGHEVSVAGSAAFIEGLSADSRPDLILCDEKVEGSTGAKVIKTLRAKPSTKQVPILLLVGGGSRSDQLRDALEAGANDAISRKVQPAEMLARVRRMLDRHSGDSPAADLANTVVILSARGGSGKTVLACNLAVAIAQLSGETVALLDLNLEFGTTATILSLQPRATLSELARASVEEPSDEAFDAMLLHHSSGVRLLPALARAGDSELVDDAALGQLIARLRKTYDHLIIDGRPSYREFMIDLWDQADSLVVPCPSDVPSVSVTQALLSAFTRVDIDNEKVLLVINHLLAKAGVPATDIERFLGKPSTTIPYGGDAFQAAVNAGRPYIMDNGAEPAGRAIRALADQLLTRHAASPRRASS